MIKTIPEQKMCYCDRCGGKVKHEGDFAAKGNIQISSRDYQGVFVGGYSMSLELCDSCAVLLSNFKDGKAIPQPPKDAE